MNIINDYKQLRIIENLNATTKLAEENKKLKEKLYTLRKAYYDEQRERMMLEYKLEKIKEYANQLEIFTHIKEDLLNIIEGAKDEL